ncbi:MAG TPA: tyrosine-protein phosphatase, partial [Gemmataceae bacterium]
MVLGNVHVVIPGEVYRSAQLSDKELDGLCAQYGIRTVINLRGCCNPAPWYLDECRATHRHGVNQEDIGFSAGRLPPVQEIRRLVEVLDRTDFPVLFHCNRGADRTGLASAVVTLLLTDASLAEGRRQLSPRFSHLALGRPANLDRFFDLYSEWLDAQGLTHSREYFRHWLLKGYCPGECRCELEILSFPEQVVCSEAFVLKVRCRNTSIKPWR